MNSNHERKIVDLGADDPHWSSALSVLNELRPQLTFETLQQVLAEGAPQGLRFTGIFVNDECVAIAGWRIFANTSATRKLYIDDLATAPAFQSQGYGAALLEELTQRARHAGCTILDLDSGVQRHDAHRFYLRAGMRINAHHFQLPL